MSNKQRADHVQAKYWNGYITRVEAQKVADEQRAVIVAQAQAIQKLDTVLTYLMKEKLGVTIEEVNAWVNQKLEEAKKAAEQTPLEKAVEAKEQATNANNQSEQQEPSSLIVAA